jgi:hypothetical protein
MQTETTTSNQMQPSDSTKKYYNNDYNTLKRNVILADTMNSFMDKMKKASKGVMDTGNCRVSVVVALFPLLVQQPRSVDVAAVGSVIATCSLPRAFVRFAVVSNAVVVAVLLIILSSSFFVSSMIQVRKQCLR